MDTSEVMEKSSSLWEKLEAILQVHLNPKRDNCGVGKLNRLVKQGFPEIKKAGFEFNSESSQIKHVENLTLSTLGKIRLAHNKAGDPAENPPLVMIHWEDVNYIIDGTHRLNYWREINFAGIFSALIITPLCAKQLEK